MRQFDRLKESEKVLVSKPAQFYGLVMEATGMDASSPKELVSSSRSALEEVLHRFGYSKHGFPLPLF